MPKRKKPFQRHAPQSRPALPLSAALHLPVLAGAALIVVITLLVYLPSLNGEFILDDDLILTENPLIKAPDGLYRFWCTTDAIDYWPVTYTTRWIGWRLWGMNPTGYHVTNLVLHMIASLLIWLLLRRLSIPGAFLAAVIFAVHPVNVESVAWIAQRKNVLAMVFLLLSILWYFKADQDSPPSQYRLYRPGVGRWYWLSLLAFVLGMLSKGSVVVLPVLLLGIVWWRRKVTWWDLVRTAPFFVIAVVLAAVNVWFQTCSMDLAIRDASFTERLVGAGAVVWFYLYKAILPINLVFIYPLWEIETGTLWWWLPLAAAAVVTAVLWWYRQGWSRPFLFAWGFFCVALVPVMGFVNVGFMKYSLVSDHYQHIAILGVIALAAAGWSVWRQWISRELRWTANVVAVLVVGMLALLSWQQNRLYRDATTLYEATLEKNPDCWQIHYNLGLILSKTGQHPKAIERYEQALRLNRDYAMAHNNLGNALVETDRLPEAIEHYRQALRLQSNFPKAHQNLGFALTRLGRLPEAIEQLQHAIQLEPNVVEYYDSLGFAFVQAGRFSEAIEQYKKAIRLKPRYFKAHKNLMLTYDKAGRASDALAAAQRALEVAQSTSQTNRAKQIEEWIISHRARQSYSPTAPPADESVSPPP